MRALLDRVGIAGALSFPQGGGNLGVADLDLGFKPPTGLGLSIDAGPVVGGGFLAFDPERGEYAGEMQLQFEGIAVRAIGLLTTRLPGGKPGFSLLVIVSAEFPPVQLGLGFMLVGVGGLLGINRTVAVEALRAGLKTGALGAVLSPPDPKANVGQLVASAGGAVPAGGGPARVRADRADRVGLADADHDRAGPRARAAGAGAAGRARPAARACCPTSARRSCGSRSTCSA